MRFLFIQRVHYQPGFELGKKVGGLLGHNLSVLDNLSDLMERNRLQEKNHLKFSLADFVYPLFKIPYVADVVLQRERLRG